MVDFRLEWLKYCTVEHIDGMPNVVYEDDPVPVPLSHCNLYVTWDPALDGKASESRQRHHRHRHGLQGRDQPDQRLRQEAGPPAVDGRLHRLLQALRPYLQASGVEEVLFQRC